MQNHKNWALDLHPLPPSLSLSLSRSLSLCVFFFFSSLALISRTRTSSLSLSLSLSFPSLKVSVHGIFLNLSLSPSVSSYRRGSFKLGLTEWVGERYRGETRIHTHTPGERLRKKERFLREKGGREKTDRRRGMERWRAEILSSRLSCP